MDWRRHRKQRARVNYRTVLRNPDIEMLTLSRAAIKLAGATLSYGVMVYLARMDASQLEIALVSVMSSIAAMLLGAQGGILADSSGKRTLIAGGCALQGICCLMIPLQFGSTVPYLMLLMFLTSAIAQLISPGLKAIVAIVATPEEMATTGALISIVGSLFAAIGSSFMAPLLITWGGLDLVLYACAVIYLFGATRAFLLPREMNTRPWKGAMRALRSWPGILLPTRQARWVRENQEVASMVLITAICVALYEGFSSVMPVYVRDVLHADPAKAVYIFSLASVGFLLGTVAGPVLISIFGERRLILISLVLLSGSMLGLGLINHLAGALAPFSPLRVVALFGVSLSDPILAASVLAIPVNLGSSLATSSIQVYINRNVAVTSQGQLFGMQDVQRQATNTVMVLGLGGLSTFLPVDAVLLIAPLLACSVVLALLRFMLQHDAIRPKDQKVTTRQAVQALMGRQTVLQ